MMIDHYREEVKKPRRMTKGAKFLMNKSYICDIIKQIRVTITQARYTYG